MSTPAPNNNESNLPMPKTNMEYYLYIMAGGEHCTEDEEEELNMWMPKTPMEAAFAYRADLSSKNLEALVFGENKVEVLPSENCNFQENGKYYITLLPKANDGYYAGKLLAFGAAVASDSGINREYSYYINNEKVETVSTPSKLNADEYGIYNESGGDGETISSLIWKHNPNGSADSVNVQIEVFYETRYIKEPYIPKTRTEKYLFNDDALPPITNMEFYIAHFSSGDSWEEADYALHTPKTVEEYYWALISGADKETFDALVSDIPEPKTATEIYLAAMYERLDM